MEILVKFTINDPKIIEQLRKGKFTDKVKEHIRDFGKIEDIDNEVENKIYSTWHIDDVKSLNEDLTDEQCRDVLEYIHNHHNTEVGINWDAIQRAINEVVG